MCEFKVGDEVEVVEKALCGNLEVGHQGVVTDIRDSGAVQVDGESCGWFYGGSGGVLKKIGMRPDFKGGDEVYPKDDHISIGFRKDYKEVIVEVLPYYNGVRLEGRGSTVYSAVYFTKKRPHYDLIIAWANGADIQVKMLNGIWEDTPYPNFSEKCEYRIKPKKSEKDLKIEEIQSKMREFEEELEKIKEGNA